ncbi:MAG: Rnase Y domain-containing protein, partial [Dehalococcoidales bacterium]|nr:Rnase Y domain-containing protein [Dehalococcoidales bacterium]
MISMSLILLLGLYVSILIVGIVLGGAIVFFFRRMAVNRLLRVTQRKTNRTVIEAREEAKRITDQSRIEAEKIRTAADAEYRERRQELQRQENRVLSKSENLEHKLEGVGQRERALNNKEKSIDTLRAQIEEAKDKELKQLEIISGMSTEQAKEMLLQSVESEMKEEASRRLHEWELKIKAEADIKSQEILAQTIQRSASEIVSETTATSVPLPSDEMKGRLIGREGRNIRALEQATGVDLIVDDTPEAVTLSSFDPVRREVARIALTKLILDGRIHPARIEEVVKKAEEEVNASIQTAGEQAAYQVG